MILDFRWFDLARHRFGLWIGREKDNNMNKTSGSRPKDSSSNNPKSKNKNPKFLLAVSTMLLALCVPALAQQPKKIPRIGYLSASSTAEALSRTDAFRQGLRELGYVEGENIVVEFLYADGKFDRLPALAADLVRLKVDVIVTAGPSVTGPVKDATATIPIVMTNDSDPVAAGFVASLARPGGNITGLSSLAQDLSGKRLELLKETVPKLARIAVLGSSAIPGNAQALKETELAARAYGLQTQYVNVQDRRDIETAFRAVRKERADALLVLNGPPHILRQIPDFAAKGRFPAIYHNLAIIDDGGLMSYGASISDLDRRAATYVDKILKGIKPADLPVEQPKKFEFIVNLRAAKQIGLTIPPNVLARADRVIR
jgi:putative tryptophan/tyrosine transport system substrate-binding protein